MWLMVLAFFTITYRFLLLQPTSFSNMRSLLFVYGYGYVYVFFCLSLAFEGSKETRDQRKEMENFTDFMVEIIQEKQG